MKGWHEVYRGTADTWRNNNVSITPKTTSQRRFDVIMTLSLRLVSAWGGPSTRSEHRDLPRVMMWKISTPKIRFAFPIIIFMISIYLWKVLLPYTGRSSCSYSVPVTLRLDSSCYCFINMVMGSRWDHRMETFSVLLALCDRDSTGHRWIPLTKANNAELWCLFWSAPDQTVEQTIETSVIWDAIALIMTSL